MSETFDGLNGETAEPAPSHERGAYEKAMALLDVLERRFKERNPDATIERPSYEDWVGMQEMSGEDAGKETSQWQPACICNAFASDGNVSPPRFVLTMQTWINLERVKSPVLNGYAPDDLDDLQNALRAFYYNGPTELTFEEWAVLAGEMADACVRGFSTRLGMKPKDAGSEFVRHGFGGWAPLFACLVTQAGRGLAEALSMPVEQANILVAAMRLNQGWEEAGEPYRQREAVEFVQDKGKGDA